jgi:hypothetical protein
MRLGSPGLLQVFALTFAESYDFSSHKSKLVTFFFQSHGPRLLAIFFLTVTGPVLTIFVLVSRPQTTHPFFVSLTGPNYSPFFFKPHGLKWLFLCSTLACP